MTAPLMTPTRRDWLIAGITTLSLGTSRSQTSVAPGTPPMFDDTMIDAAEPRFDPVPPLPAQPTPGKPGDFAFLDGHWKIRHLKRRKDHWDRFEGEAHCWTILGGVGHVEELLIPARDFSGLGLRMLDVANRQWSDHWVNAKSGVVTTPGQLGSFEKGSGLFSSTYDDDGKTVLLVGIWDCIGPGVCRWRQVYSTDAGKTWAHDWVMHWRRVA